MRSAKRLSVFVAVVVFLASGSVVAQSDTEILFRVNMNVQIAEGGFDPAADTVVVRGALNAWGCSDPLLDDDVDGIYELEIQVPGHELGAGAFKYNISCADDLWETRDNRTYEVTGQERDDDGDGFGEIALDVVFYDDVTGAVDVEILFRVDMSVQEEQGSFDSAVDTVVIRGALNDWGCSEPMEEAEPGVYELEIQVPGHALGLAEFKYNINDLTCIDGFWETRDNRLYEVSGNEPDEDGDGFLEIVLDDVFFDDVFAPGLNVELLFRVDMSVQIELGNFDPAVDAPVVSGGFNAWECSEPMVEVEEGIYEVRIRVPGHGVGGGEYKFRMACDTRWEQGANRFYEVIGDEPDEDGDDFVEVVVEPRFFDDNEGGVDVEILFRVDMSVQVSTGLFDPGVNSVVVRGGINGWGCSDLMEELDEDIYELEVQVPGHIVGAGEYKFNVDCGDGGWETRGNRAYEVTGDEPDSDGDGFLEIILDPPPFFDDMVPTEPVEVDVLFRVDMSVQIALGTFDFEQDTVVFRGELNAWECSETFTHAGDGIYELELQRVNLVPGPQEYKFNIGCSDDGWEAGDNRSFNVDVDDVVITVERFFNDNDTAPPFVRGDTNSDGTINITDSVFALSFLFGGEANTPSCMDALDANDDGGVNITDPILVLNFLFGGGDAPPAPNPGTANYTRDDCGPDPTLDTLSCAAGAQLCTM